MTQDNVWSLLVTVLGVLLLPSPWSTTQRIEPLPDSELRAQLEAADIDAPTLLEVHQNDARLA